MRQRGGRARGGARRDPGYQRDRGHGGSRRSRVIGRADGARGAIGAPGHMDMLRALLLVAEEQGCAQGAAYLRYDAGHQSAGHQSGTLPYHDLAGGRAAAQMCAIGRCLPPLTDRFLFRIHITHEAERVVLWIGGIFGDLI